ncbi:MAG: amidase domain-containing protein [Clostridia bacterium]|nr:amidase domain-containing protein [Clostridia bacterium]
MKQTKRLFAVLLAVVMLLGLVPVMNIGMTASAAGGTINQSKITEYALEYWDNYNSNYSNYNSDGGDCCNFVSQCLHYAGLPMDSNWYWSAYSDHTSSWTYCPSLKSYLVDNLKCDFITSPSASQIEVGDVLYYGGGSHVGICSEVIDGQPWVCAHNNDRHTSNWKLGYSTYAVIKTSDLATAYADLGEEFYAVILNTKYWKPISLNTSTNKITLETEKNVPYQKWRFTQQSDGAYLIESCVNGNALEMTNGERVDRTQLTAHNDWWGGYYQQWYLIPRGDGYIFQSKHYSGEQWVMDLRGSSNNDGSVIQIYQRNDSYADDETWSVNKIDDYSTTSNVKTDKSIYPLGSDVKITWNYCVGANSYSLVVWKAGEWRNGQWTDSHQVLSTSINKSTTSYTYRPSEDGGYTFMVKAVGVEEESSVCRIIVNPQAVDLGEDFFAEIVNTSTGRVIGNYDNNVQASSNEANDPRLIWHFMRNSDGSYLAYNTYNSALLTAENSGASNGDNIICKTRYEGASQRWVVTQKNGVDCLVSSSKNRLMSLQGASPEPGTNVYLWRDNGPNGTAAQGFTIVKKTDYARPDAPDAPQLSIATLGSQNTDTVFTWTASPLKSEKYDNRTYNLRIWQGSELGVNGTEYTHVLDLTDTTCSVRLPKGNYTAYLTAANTKYHWFSTPSNSITFTIGDHTHAWECVATQNATCIATGTKTFTCSCGASYTETIPINSSNHVNITNVTATTSTCTAHGYTAGVYCNDCMRYISGHEAQPLAAHTLTTINQRNATCTAEGYTGDQYCTTCRQTISTGTAIGKTAHTLTVINQRNATYDAEGYTGDQYCTTCQQTITTGTAIPKLVRPTDPTPSNPQPSGSCKWCGQNHGGAFGWLIRIIHNILAAIFGAKY